MKSFLSCLLLFCSALLLASESKVTQVVLYRSGAMIKRTAWVKIENGRTTLSIPNLPYDVDPNSISVKGYGDFTITGVEHRANWLKGQASSTASQILLDEKEKLEKSIALQNANMESLVEWESFLTSNKVVTGKDEPISSLELAKIEQNFRENIKKVKEAKVALQFEINAKQKELEKLNQQIRTNQSSEKPTSGIEITTQSDTDLANAKLEITYFTRQAFWSPKYQIKVEDIGQPLTLNYQAKISQNTGEDWKDVKLIFSSANPSVNQNLPNFSPFPLNFRSEDNDFYSESEKVKTVKKNAVMEMSSLKKEDGNEYKEMVASAPQADYSDGSSFFEYQLSSPFTVENGVKNMDVVFHSQSVPATYQYKALPYQDKKAYLTAKIENFAQLNVLPGEASVYYQQSYVGKLNLEQSATFSEISLGKDDNIMVEYTNLAGSKKSSGLTSNKENTLYQWEIKITNQKNRPINIEIVDRVPVSKEGSIIVENKVPTGGAEFDASLGKLSWVQTIGSGKQVILYNQYEIKYPKEQQIQALP
ncbi:MAG: hypothetical protein C4K58_01475 [Flavobacteriaceae bacterium]|nr:MAG: hypothetical protein C4K58_01475 [Flavobacteriaceae bacterium]